MPDGEIGRWERGRDIAIEILGAGRVLLLLALGLPLLALISFPFLWDAGVLNPAI